MGKNNEILYLLLDDYADHEPVFLSTAVSCDEKEIGRASCRERV